MELYKIKWKMKATGASGEGQLGMGKKLAEAWVKHLDVLYKDDIDHWIEKVGGTKNET